MISFGKKLPHKRVMISIAALLVFPLFFQLSGKIFYDHSYNFNTMGNLSRLPIPVSIFACFSGLLIIGNYGSSKAALCMIFSFFIIMLGTTFISTKGFLDLQRDKLILLIQFILPMFSLVLGQIYGSRESNKNIFEKTALYIVMSIIPAQLFATWLSGIPVLSPSLFIFSIYQHLQYVPTIFVSLYFIGLFTLWNQENYKKVLIFIAPLIGTYTQFSLSMLTNLILFLGLFTFIVYKWVKVSDKLPIILSLLVITSSIGTYWIFRDNENFLQKYHFEKSSLAKKSEKNSSNVSERIRIWKFYITGITADKKMLLFGNAERPKRTEYPSAHNYYLDLAYNFGILSLIPIIAMLILTLKRVFNLRKTLFEDSALVGLVFVTFYLLLIDNSFKVGLRQPYPGIITFFLWGLLLSRLSAKQSSSSANKAK